MPKKKIAFVNPFLNEYVYTVLSQVTREQKKNLSAATLRILSTPARTKFFSVNSTEEEKKIVLTELGYNWAVVINPKGVKSVNELKQMLIKLEQGRTAKGVQHLVNENMFVTTDKQTAFVLGMAGQTISHDNYFMNLDLLRMGHILKKWRERIANEDNDHANELRDFSALIDRFIYSSNLNIKCTESFIGITEPELRILQYFCINQHLYLDKERLVTAFKGIIKINMVTTCLKKLFAADYIRKHIESKPQKYTITASGIMIVSRFRSRVLNTMLW